MLHVVAAMAEFERDLIRERIKAGLRNARAKARYWAGHGSQQMRAQLRGYAPTGVRGGLRNRERSHAKLQL